MRTINIAGRDLQMGYNMQTGIAYERITEKSSLELSEFQNGKTEPLITLGYCMLLSCNPAEQVPPMDEILRSVQNIHDMTRFMEAVGEELKSFFTPEPGDKQERKGEKGRKSKKASQRVNSIPS